MPTIHISGGITVNPATHPTNGTTPLTPPFQPGTATATASAISKIDPIWMTAKSILLIPPNRDREDDTADWINPHRDRDSEDDRVGI